MELKYGVEATVAAILFILGIAYALWPSLREATRARVRRNVGNAAGVDAGVAGAAISSLAGVAAAVSLGFDTQSVVFRTASAVVVIGLIVGVPLIVVSLGAFLGWGPRWAVRDPRDFWVAEVR